MYRKLASVIALVVISLLPAGCMTTLTKTGVFVPSASHQSSGWSSQLGKPFSGTRAHVGVLASGEPIGPGHALFAFIDLPLSLGLDVALLPVDVVFVAIRGVE